MSLSRCECCQESVIQAKISRSETQAMQRRRLVMASPLLLTFLHTTSLAQSSSGLLSPFSKPKNREAQDANQVQSQAISQAGTAIVNSRSMAERTVAALAGLCSMTNSLIEQLNKLKAEIASEQRKRADLEAAKIAEMEDYRNGLFCSGCNRTKRDILSKGETFPHPGQKIIQPTPEQIANKDAELQRPIDQLIADLSKKEKDATITDSIMRDGRDQIEFGVWLWEAALGSEREALRKQHQRKLEKMQLEIKQIEKTLSDLQFEEMNNKKKAEVANLEVDRKMWSEVLQKRREAVNQEVLDYQRQTAKLERIYNEEQSRIVEVTSKSPLSQQIAAVPQTRGRNAGLAPFNLGVLFRLGRMLSRNDVLTQSNPGAVPAVEKFIQDYKQASF